MSHVFDTPECRIIKFTHTAHAAPTYLVTNGLDFTDETLGPDVPGVRGLEGDTLVVQ